jgi:hypothetical protein
MVLKNNIIKYLIVLIIVTMAVLFSCEETPLSLGFCATCLSEKPDEGTVEITLKSVFSEQSVRIRIYEGYLEDSVLLASWLTPEVKTARTVPLNKIYTITASYYLNGSTYVAVNSVLPRVKYDESSCETPCYYIYDNKVNLRLKWSK